MVFAMLHAKDKLMGVWSLVFLSLVCLSFCASEVHPILVISSLSFCSEMYIRSCKALECSVMHCEV